MCAECAGIIIDELSEELDKEHTEQIYFSEELFEKLASVQHDIWADWMKQTLDEYAMAAPCMECMSGESILLSIGCEYEDTEYYATWKQLINTQYKNLTKEEKESNRERVRKFWHLIKTEDTHTKKSYQGLIKILKKHYPEVWEKVAMAENTLLKFLEERYDDETEPFGNGYNKGYMGSG